MTPPHHGAPHYCFESFDSLFLLLLLELIALKFSSGISENSLIVNVKHKQDYCNSGLFLFFFGGGDTSNAGDDDITISFLTTKAAALQS